MRSPSSAVKGKTQPAMGHAEGTEGWQAQKGLSFVPITAFTFRAKAKQRCCHQYQRFFLQGFFLPWFFTFWPKPPLAGWFSEPWLHYVSYFLYACLSLVMVGKRRGSGWQALGLGKGKQWQEETLLLPTSIFTKKKKTSLRQGKITWGKMSLLTTPGLVLLVCGPAPLLPFSLQTPLPACSCHSSQPFLTAFLSACFSCSRIS